MNTSKAKRQKLIELTTEEAMKYLFPSKKLRTKAYKLAHEKDDEPKRTKVAGSSRKASKTK